jgi:hypothetical protein
MNIKNLLEALEGVQTIESVKSILSVNKKKAIYYVSRLRKPGYVKTRKREDNTRIYSISFQNRLKGTSYYEIINEHSPVKLSIPEIYKIYGREPSLEETFIFALKTKSLRTILAALALFRKITNWTELYWLAKKNRLERQVGALYDLSKRIMRVRKMTDRFRNNALPKKEYNYAYVIPGIMSKDFSDIEKAWKVYLPFNKRDLEDYG